MMVLRVINDDDQHFIVRSTEPIRIEVSVVNGRVIMHAYHGSATNPTQEPNLVYDGNNEENHSSASSRNSDGEYFTEPLFKNSPT